MSYDAWKLRAPEDEPGYWSGRTPECGDYYIDRNCEGCGDWLKVCAACERCESCHEDDEEDEHLTIPCCNCGKSTTRDPIYQDLCYRCIRADNE